LDHEGGNHHLQQDTAGAPASGPIAPVGAKEAPASNDDGRANKCVATQEAMGVHGAELMAVRAAAQLGLVGYLLKLVLITHKLRPAKFCHVFHHQSLGRRLTRGQKLSFVGPLDGLVVAELALCFRAEVAGLIR